MKYRLYKIYSDGVDHDYLIPKEQEDSFYESLKRINELHEEGTLEHDCEIDNLLMDYDRFEGQDYYVVLKEDNND